MTKADLVEGLSNKLGVPKIEAEQAVDSLIEHTPMRSNKATG
jgi:nucleoid DNA-binding protein